MVCWAAARAARPALLPIHLSPPPAPANPPIYTLTQAPHVHPYPAPSTEWGAGPDKYVNRYRHAWPAALANIALAVEDAKRRRHRGGIYVPTGTCGQLVVPELPAPLVQPKFKWEPLQVGGSLGGLGGQFGAVGRRLWAVGCRVGRGVQCLELPGCVVCPLTSPS